MPSAFSQASLNALSRAYPDATQRLCHSLADQPLLKLERLVELGAAFPPESVEYNPGNLPIGIRPEDVPAPKLSITETIRSIEENGSWMVLKRIEQDPAYAVLLEDVLAEIRDVVTPITGEMLTLQGFIFISSPGAVTPFHFDPEHNILCQIRGSKVMTIFPQRDESIVPAHFHEGYHTGGHRNLTWDECFATKGVPHPLTPGDAVYVPVKAPHWVKNGGEVSISLSVTWRSTWSYEEADARAFNKQLRRIGHSPKPPRALPASNRAKALAWRAMRRLMR
jgi:oxalate decarboxylase/phosphoglucose isomerase-like protein (cupin superfamily)